MHSCEETRSFLSRSAPSLLLLSLGLVPVGLKPGFLTAEVWDFGFVTMRSKGFVTSSSFSEVREKLSSLPDWAAILRVWSLIHF